VIASRLGSPRGKPEVDDPGRRAIGSQSEGALAWPPGVAGAGAALRIVTVDSQGTAADSTGGLG
jgi:hypothetical protein